YGRPPGPLLTDRNPSPAGSSPVTWPLSQALPSDLPITIGTSSRCCVDDVGSVGAASAFFAVLSFMLLTGTGPSHRTQRQGSESVRAASISSGESPRVYLAQIH